MELFILGSGACACGGGPTDACATDGRTGRGPKLLMGTDPSGALFDWVDVGAAFSRKLLSLFCMWPACGNCPSRETDRAAWMAFLASVLGRPLPARDPCSTLFAAGGCSLGYRILAVSRI